MSAPAREPFFGNIPAVVTGLCALIVLVSALVLLGPGPWSDRILAAAAVQIGPARLPRLLGPYLPFVLHVLVHGGWLHLGLNTLGLLAFGAPVARWLQALHGPRRGALDFLALFFLAAIAGALSEALAIMLTGAPGAVLIGASGGLMGLIGVLVRLNYGQSFTPLPLFSRPVMAAMAPWIGLNLLIGLFGAPGVSAPIAWPAHLGGLFAGAALAGLFARKD